MSSSQIISRLPVLTRNSNVFLQEEYREHKWNKKTFTQKIAFFIQTIITFGDHFKCYTECIKREFQIKYNEVSRHHPSEITLVDKIRLNLPGCNVSIGKNAVPFNLAGVLCVGKDGYVYLRMSTRPYQRLFNYISQASNGKVEKGDFPIPHVTVAWAEEGMKSKDFFNRLKGRVVTLESASYSVHGRILKVDFKAKNLEILRLAAGLSPQLTHRKVSGLVVPFHMTLGKTIISANAERHLPRPK